MQTYETLSEAMNALKAKGYTSDFNLHPEWIEAPSLNMRLKPEEFHVDEVYRFEGMTSPDDSSVLYAVSSSKGIKGLLVDAYGAYSESISPIMIDKLRIDRDTDRAAEHRSAEQVKKSVKKVASPGDTTV
jgi:hypothetical protein